jgi:hypothetical protein
MIRKAGYSRIHIGRCSPRRLRPVWFFLRVDPSDIVLRNIEVDSEDGAGVRVQMN